jgi:hypothetical protein
MAACHKIVVKVLFGRVDGVGIDCHKDDVIECSSVGTC